MISCSNPESYPFPCKAATTLKKFRSRYTKYLLRAGNIDHNQFVVRIARATFWGHPATPMPWGQFWNKTSSYRALSKARLAGPASEWRFLSKRLLESQCEHKPKKQKDHHRMCICLNMLQVYLALELKISHQMPYTTNIRY